MRKRDRIKNKNREPLDVPVKFDFFRGGRIMVATFSGPFTREHVYEVSQQVLTREKMIPATGLLVDLRQVTALQVDAAFFEGFYQEMKRRGQRRGRTAIVVGDDDGHRTVLESAVAIGTKYSNSPRAVFDRLESAVAWLQGMAS